MENKMSKNEFWLGIAIITFCVGFWSLVEPLPSHTTINVKITKIDKEQVVCKTSEEGVVDCHVEKR